MYGIAQEREREHRLGQLVGGEQSVGGEVQLCPSHEIARVWPRQRCPHRCCIDRRVVCPQNPDQGISVHVGMQVVVNDVDEG